MPPNVHSSALSPTQLNTKMYSPRVHHSTIYHIQDMEATQVPINK